ncbi:MAG TPA: hypothetical protein DIT48_12770 [Actinobacteria bacterium]|nr:hypothetical protein [Actinomycetota bacterium]
MVSKRTTIWLTDQDVEALRHAARATGRTQSDLVREGVRIITREVGGQPSAEDRPPPDMPSWWLTRRQGRLLVLKNIGVEPADAARELRITEEEAASGYREIDEWLEASHRRHAQENAAAGTLSR